MNNSKNIAKILTYISIFLIPFYIFRFSIFGIPTNIFEISVLVAFLSTIYYLLSTKTKIVFGPIWPYLFLIIAAISAYVASDHIRALGILKGWFFVPIVLYLIVINLFSAQKTRLAVPFFVSTIIISIWAILQKVGIIGALFYQKNVPEIVQYLIHPLRAFGPFDSPNFLAMYLAPMIFLSIPIFKMVDKKYQKFIIILIFALPSIAIYFSGSRAGLLALIASTIVYLINETVWHKNKKALWASLALGVVLVYGFYGFLTTKDSSRAISNNSRIVIYKYSLELARDNPILGVGLGDFHDDIAVITKNDGDFQVYKLPYAVHPHNVFLAVWLNLGLAGLIIFLIILFRFFKYEIYTKDRFQAGLVLSAMTAILVHGLFDTTYFKNDLSAIFWLIIAIKIIYEKREENVIAKV